MAKSKPKNNARIIFVPGEERKLTKEEIERSVQPAAQNKELIRILAGWSKYAADQLNLLNSRYSTKPPEFIEFGQAITLIHTTKIPCINESTGEQFATLYYYPGIIPEDATIDEIAHCKVLKAVQALWESIFTDNKSLIANLGIELGLAAAKAHAMPFEEFAVTGKKVKAGAPKGGEAKNAPTNKIKKAFIDYFINNREKYNNNKSLATLEMIEMKGTMWYKQNWRTAYGWLTNI